MDVERIRAKGPWVLVKPEEPPKMSKGGLYLPEGNRMERLGHTVARVVSVGEGYWEPDKKGKLRFIRHGVSKGDRVVFRGHLKDANKIDISDSHCFMHAKDLVGILEEGAELNLSLPYDN